MRTQNIRQQQPPERLGKRAPDISYGLGPALGWKLEPHLRDQRQRCHCKGDGDHQSQPDARQDTPARDHHSAQDRRYGNGNSPQDRLYGEPHGAPPGRQGIPDDREDRRAGHAGPCQGKHRPGKDQGPGPCRYQQEIADDRDADKSLQTHSSAVSVGDPPARILRQPVEQIASAAIGAHYQQWSTAALQVFREEPLPELLPQRHEEPGAGNGGGVAVEPQPDERRPTHGPALRARASGRSATTYAITASAATQRANSAGSSLSRVSPWL